MIYGTVYKSLPPEDLDAPAVCSFCKEPCDRAVQDDSYDDHFGTVHDYCVVSNCCGEPILEPIDCED